MTQKATRSLLPLPLASIPGSIWAIRVLSNLVHEEDQPDVTVGWVLGVATHAGRGRPPGYRVLIHAYPDLAPTPDDVDRTQPACKRPCLSQIVCCPLWPEYYKHLGHMDISGLPIRKFPLFLHPDFFTGKWTIAECDEERVYTQGPGCRLATPAEVRRGCEGGTSPARVFCGDLYRAVREGWRGKTPLSVYRQMGWGADMTRLPKSAGGGSNGTPEQQAIWRGLKARRLKKLDVAPSKKKRAKASSTRATKVAAPTKSSKRPAIKKAAKSRRDK